MPTSFDAFISYSSTDLQVAEIVYGRLIRGGLDIWFDKFRLRPGCDWHQEIEAGCEASRIILPILTPAWHESEWCRFETYGAEHVIPLWFSGEWELVAPPPVRAYQRADLRESQESAWDELVASIRDFVIRRAPEKPTRVTSLPFGHNPYFVGRERLLVEIHERLCLMPTAALTQGSVHAIAGLGGVGKTTLAREYAEKYWRLYQDILWVRADLSLVMEFARLALTLRPDPSAPPLRATPSESPENDAALAMKELSGRRTRLLILDNAPDEEAVMRWLPGGGCHTLITSRFAGWSASVQTIGVEVLEPEAAREVLLRRSGLSRTDTNVRGADQLANELGCLPLALEQDGAFMRETRTGLEQYLALYKQNRKELLSERALGGTQYLETVATTWHTTVGRLRALARDLLRLASFLAPDHIPYSVLEQAATLLARAPSSEPKTRLKATSVFLRLALRELSNYSLMSLGEQGSSIHRLIQAVQVDELDTQQRGSWCDLAVLSSELAYLATCLSDPRTAARALHRGEAASQAPGRLDVKYETRFNNLLLEYSGTPEHPVPFGGRQAELNALDSWLEDARACPYLLLTAPAGRGKSTLLFHWARRLQEQRNLAVIFLPVSVRFETNLARVLFPALAGRLSVLHHESLPPEGERFFFESWRPVVDAYLHGLLPDGRRLVIVLDGLDEAADWDASLDFFQAAPPSGLRIVVSARVRPGDPDGAFWLRTLGWDRSGLGQTWTLNQLTRAGVADVLQHMGTPLELDLEQRTDLVSDMYRLTEGDPLLLRLYVDSLHRGEVAFHQDLLTIQPEVEGYFERWWRDHIRLSKSKPPLQEPTVRLLSLLSCALGPLNQEDLLCLMPPQFGLTSWKLKESLGELSRFVIGDSEKVGYTLGHPRLGHYFRERMTSAERTETETWFLTWGASTIAALNERCLAPESVSPYLVRHYGGHLELARAGADAFAGLVTEHWKRAWDVHGESPRGFLDDVARAWRAASHDNAEQVRANGTALYLTLEVHCALYYSGAKRNDDTSPIDVTYSLIGGPAGNLGEALAAACNTKEKNERKPALEHLAGQLTLLPSDQLYALWAATLPVLATGPRDELVDDLRALLPVILQLCGAEAAQALDALGNAS